MGRAWRNGQIDAASAPPVSRSCTATPARIDPHGNELVVTEVAVADEIAAAADLVKGKLTGDPVAVVRGLPAGVVTETDATARHLVGPAPTTCSGWAPPKPSSWAAAGRAAPPLRPPVRAEPVPPQLIEAAVAEALTAPAPHHTRPVRFVWLQTRADATGCSSGCGQVACRPDRRRQARRRDRAPGRARPNPLRRTRSLIPFLVPDGAHGYPDAARTAAEHTMFTVAVGAAVQALLVALAVRGVGSCWVGSTIFAPDVVRDELDLPRDWEPLGAIAIGYPDQPVTEPREPAQVSGLLVHK